MRDVEGQFVDENFGEIFNPDMIIEYGGGASSKGILYIDPAFTIGENSDYTGIVKAYSDRSKIYIDDVFVGRVEVDEWLRQLRNMYDDTINKIGYDAWGIQGTTNMREIRNYFRNNGIYVKESQLQPSRLNVDNFTDTMLRLFFNKSIFFSKKVRENKLFMEQLFNFTSKKKNQYDDGVDAFFNAVYLLIELNYFRNEL